MVESTVRLAVVVGAGVLWIAGLRLFLASNLSRRRKAGWTALLVLVGVAIGIVLPLSDVWSKFILLMVIMPVLGLADVALLRPRRSLSFWIRACGFEVCTVFGVAAASRFVLDLLGAAAWLATGPVSIAGLPAPVRGGAAQHAAAADERRSVAELIDKIGTAARG